MSVVMTGGRAAVVAFAVGGVEAFEGGLADVLAFGLGHRSEECEQDSSGAAGVVDAGQGAGEHLEDQAVGGEVVGQGGELGSVTPETFHLVDGEDDPAVRSVGLDLAGQGEGGLELGTHPDPGADLLGEDLLSRNPVRGKGIELRLHENEL
jgi:hypothetical protein